MRLENGITFSMYVINGRLTFFPDYVVQEQSLPEENSPFQDEGYSGSQENTCSSFEMCSDESIFSNYFSEQPNLNDCSFNILCTQESGFPNVTEGLLFEEL